MFLIPVSSTPIRRYCCALLCVLLVVLSSCGGVPDDIASQIGDFYSELDACSMVVEISADFGDRVSAYTITYAQTQPGSADITIEKPDEIAGITASVNGADTTLRYDGLILETGKLAGTALTPIDAVPSLVSVWASGYASEIGAAKWNDVKCVLLSYSATVDGSAIERRTWFDAGTLEPVHAETFVDGRMVIACDFSNITINSTPKG